MARGSANNYEQTLTQLYFQRVNPFQSQIFWLREVFRRKRETLYFRIALQSKGIYKPY
jgi:hypothetical protein